MNKAKQSSREPAPLFRDPDCRARTIRAIVGVIRKSMPELLSDTDQLVTPAPLNSIKPSFRIYDPHDGRLDWKLRDYLALDIVASVDEVEQAIKEAESEDRGVEIAT